MIDKKVVKCGVMPIDQFRKRTIDFFEGGG